jgi:hypothetical protein
VPTYDYRCECGEVTEKKWMGLEDYDISCC